MEILHLVAIYVAVIYSNESFILMNNCIHLVIYSQQTGKKHIINFKAGVISQDSNRFVPFAGRLHNHFLFSPNTSNKSCE